MLLLALRVFCSAFCLFGSRAFHLVECGSATANDDRRGSEGEGEGRREAADSLGTVRCDGRAAQTRVDYRGHGCWLLGRGSQCRVESEARAAEQLGTCGASAGAGAGWCWCSAGRRAPASFASLQKRVAARVQKSPAGYSMLLELSGKFDPSHRPCPTILLAASPTTYSLRRMRWLGLAPARPAADVERPYPACSDTSTHDRRHHHHACDASTLTS